MIWHNFNYAFGELKKITNNKCRELLIRQLKQAVKDGKIKTKFGVYKAILKSKYKDLILGGI